ncbi:MAG: class I SAM-dependent methyltransferase [Bacteroidetes bacterium]|nr:class I SAM-dependent methyltransferase [Bacteroidota bacterium]
MKEVKDIFSKQAATYFKFRPESPAELYDFLLKKVNCFETAWDCGTGNGQVAGKLADYFELVYATDVSEQQMSHAVKKKNIIYKTERAEQSTLPDHSVDLVTVAQAVHWFDFDSFYAEVKRVVKPGGLIALWTYVLLQIDNGPIDEIINKIYVNILGDYWDKERKWVDEQYQTIPFPFEEIPTPVFRNKVTWTKEQLLGYLNTWSAAGHYAARHGYSPVTLIAEDLDSVWPGNSEKEIIFPVLMRLGRI